MNVIDKLYETKGEAIQRVNDAIVKDQFPEIKQLYVELNIMKDTRLGTMVNFAPSPSDVQYLIDKLPDYNKRLQRNFKYAYPDYPLGELDLEMRYRDPVNSEAIFSHSPDTEFMPNIYQYMNSIAEQNARACYHSKISFIINVWPLQITPRMRQWLEAVQSYTRGFSFGLMSMDPKEIPFEFWSQCQVLFFDDLIPHLTTESQLCDPLFKDGRLMGTFIYAPYQVEQKLMDKFAEENTIIDDPEAVDCIFELTATYMAICCKFKYITFKIPTP